MGNQQPKDSYLDELDEHNQPTEPLPPPNASPFAPTEDDSFIPAPQPYERPFPQQVVLPGPTGGLPPGSAYPQLPPTSVAGGWERPPGGVIPAVPATTQKPLRSTPRRSPWPILLGLFFVAVQLLLVVRFVLKLISWPANSGWVGIVYGVSEVFVWPFQLLWKSLTLPIPIPGALELFTLLAIVAYWLLSRILVHLLKAILRSR